MKKLIPRYTFLKNKYGSELLVDIVELKDIKKYVVKSSVHTLTYYDITFITEGEGSFILDNHTYRGGVGDVFFSKPGEIRSWAVSTFSKWPFSSADGRMMVSTSPTSLSMQNGPSISCIFPFSIR